MGGFNPHTLPRKEKMGRFDDNFEERERKEPVRIRGELFTTQVILDNRSYFFNVKENRNKDVFLQIVESKPADQGEGERRAIVVFADTMRDFLRGLDQSLSFIDKEQKERSKLRAEKRAERDAKYGHSDPEKSFADEKPGAKKVYRRKGESRLVASKREEKARVHVVSKRPGSDESEEF